MLVDGNALLAELDARRSALAQIIVKIDEVARQIKGFVQDNKAALKPTIDQLDGVLALLQRNKAKLDQSLDGLVSYSTALGEQVGAGPYFGAYISNWGIDYYLQILVDSIVWPAHVPKDFQNYLTNPAPSLLPFDTRPPVPPAPSGASDKPAAAKPGGGTR